MKKLMLILLAVGFISFTFGCGGTDSGPAVPEGIPFPDWFMNPPSDTGEKAMYGTGMYTMDDLAEAQLAKSTSAAQARNELAASMKAKLQSVLKSYDQKIRGKSGKTQYISLTEQAMRQLVDNDIYGAKIVKQEMRAYKDQYLWFSLLKIGFDGVAKALHTAAQQEFEEVEEKSKAAFDELDKLLATENEKKPVDHGSSVPADQLPTPK